MSNVRKSNRGFTLVEILIVVIILGILAAIVIPQFTNASQDARRSGLASTVQTLRSQIELYKLQHKDTVPNLIGGAANDVTNWDPLTTKTDADGNPSNVATDPGPYMQSAPNNQMVPSGTGTIVKVGDSNTAPDGTCGYYQRASDGKIWGVDRDNAGNYVLIGD